MAVIEIFLEKVRVEGYLANRHTTGRYVYKSGHIICREEVSACADIYAA